MKAKLALLTGAAAGYVLGAKAGRQRYDELKAMAKQAMDSEPVHAAAAKVNGRHADRQEPYDSSMPLD